MRILTVKNGQIVEQNASAQASNRQRDSVKIDPVNKARSSHPVRDQNDLLAQIQAGDALKDDIVASAKKGHKTTFNQVYERAVYLLSMRDHSRRELEIKLDKKFPSSEWVEGVLERLIEERFLDDIRFSDAYVRMRSARGVGPMKIIAELGNRGISRSVINDALLLDDEYWFEVVARAYTKKFSDRPVMDYQDWSKRARFLQNRGFTKPQIDLVIPSIE